MCTDGRFEEYGEMRAVLDVVLVKCRNEGAGVT